MEVKVKIQRTAGLHWLRLHDCGMPTAWWRKCCYHCYGTRLPVPIIGGSDCVSTTWPAVQVETLYSWPKSCIRRRDAQAGRSFMLPPLIIDTMPSKPISSRISSNGVAYVTIHPSSRPTCPNGKRCVNYYCRQERHMVVELEETKVTMVMIHMRPATIAVRPSMFCIVFGF